MPFKKRSLILFVATASIWAASLQAEDTWLKTQLNAANGVTCLDDNDCDDKWAMAVIFVTEYAQMGIKGKSDLYIETFRSPNLSKQLQARADRISNEDGTYEITSEWTCGYVLSCTTSPTLMKAAFNQYLKTGKLPEPADLTQ